jgi:TonB family protein
MNPPAGQPRARRPVAKKPVQLNLRRTPTWPEEDELNERPDGNFWKWFGIVALCHLLAFILLVALYHRQPKPPENFIELVPAGQTVKGAPGPSTAHKIAPTTPAPAHHEAVAPTPPPTPAPPKPKVEQVRPTPTPKPPPILKDNAPAYTPPKLPKPKPVPKPPKVKVDLTLANAPDDDTPPPPKPAKPRTHPKKPAHKADTNPDAHTETDSPGLSKEQVAAKLGDQFKDSGTEKADRAGVNGSEHSRQSDFSDFYQSIHDQVMNKWTVPNVVDESVSAPVVQIHVDQDGRVPASRVALLRSSNNPAVDQSALEAARSMGYTLQPLPDGCNPDISITFDIRQ